MNIHSQLLIQEGCFICFHLDCRMLVCQDMSTPLPRELQSSAWLDRLMGRFRRMTQAYSCPWDNLRCYSMAERSVDLNIVFSKFQGLLFSCMLCY